MSGPESVEEAPVRLSLKQSIKLSMARKRMEAARELDANVEIQQIARAETVDKIMMTAARESSRSHHEDPPIPPISPGHTARKELPVLINNPEVAQKYEKRWEELFAAPHQAPAHPDNPDLDYIAPPTTWRTAADGVQEITISSYSHFIDIITNCKNLYNPLTQRYNTKLAFHGSPSRGSGIRSELLKQSLEHDEPRLIENFMNDNNVVEISLYQNIWGLLSFMHFHHSITRLVEWTLNPNIALFFAISDLNCLDMDGEIWLVKPSNLYASQSHPFSERLAESHLFCPTVEQQLSILDSFEPEIDPDDPVAMLHKFDNLSPASDKPCLVFFEPREFNASMINQSCLYSMASNPGIAQDEILSRPPQCGMRIIIPSFLKMILSASLKLVGIHENYVYADWSSPEPYHNSSKNKGIIYPSPELVQELLENRHLADIEEKRSERLAREAAEKELREQRHKEKLWPFEQRNSGSYKSVSSRGILCKKKFIPSHEPADEMSFILSVNSKVENRRRRSEDTFTLISLSQHASDDEEEDDAKPIVYPKSVVEEGSLSEEEKVSGTALPQVKKEDGSVGNDDSQAEESISKPDTGSSPFKDLFNSPIKGIHSILSNLGLNSDTKKSQKL